MLAADDIERMFSFPIEQSAATIPGRGRPTMFMDVSVALLAILNAIRIQRMNF